MKLWYRAVVIAILTITAMQAQQLDNLILQVVEGGGKNDGGEWNIDWFGQFEQYVSTDSRIVVIAFNGSTRDYGLYEVDNNNDTTCVYRATFQRSATPEEESPERLRVFKELTDSAIAKYPANNFTLKYTGHGSSSVTLFGGFISKDEYVEEYLNHTVATLGKKIDLLDYNTNCNVLSVNQLEVQAKYARYFIASELYRGGYSFEPTFSNGDPVSYMNDIMPLMDDAYYLQLFDDSSSIEGVAKGLCDKLRTYWEFDPVRRNMTKDKVVQSVYVVDCEKFTKLYDYMYLPEQNFISEDYLVKALQDQDPTAIPLYNDAMLYGVTNRDFFTWESPNLYDGPIFAWVEPRSWGNNNKTVVSTPDTTVEYDTTNLIGIDTVSYATRSVQSNNDTVVTTKKYERTSDTTVIRTDSLENGVRFYRDYDSSRISVDSTLLSSTNRTIVYQGNYDTTTAFYNGYDTTTFTVLDSTVVISNDTVVTTETYRVIADHSIKFMYITLDYVEDHSVYDTLSTTYDTTLTATEDDTLFFSTAVAISYEGVQKMPSKQFTVAPNPVSKSSGTVFFLVPESFNGMTEISIYDAVGNRLDYQMEYLVGGERLAWDLCNQYGVPVEAGSYVALLKTTHADGTVSIEKAMIGIKAN